MARSASIRASDADRDAVADRLHRAAVEGRIEADELEERLHAALRARTYGDLKRLVADLPSDRPQRRRSPAGTAIVVAFRLALVLVAVVAVITVAVLMAAWWILWALLWMTLRGRRYGLARPRGWNPHFGVARRGWP
jgi:Flp pilus assembly protein TadB